MLDIKSSLQRARSLVEAGDRNAAISILNNALAEHPKSIDICISLAKNYYDGGDPQRAASFLDIADTIQPTNFYVFYYRAKLAMDRSDFEAVYQVWQEASIKTKGKISPVEYSNVLKSLSDSKSLMTVQKLNLDSSFKVSAIKGRAPLEGCLHVSLVKDEQDIIYFSLESSYDMGFRFFVVGDNGSVDSTWSELERFQDDHRDCVIFLVKDPVVTHYQAAKTMGLARLGCAIFEAMGHPIKWIFPLDADEIICSFSEDRLIEALGDEEKRLITYCLFNSYGDMRDAHPAGTDFHTALPNSKMVVPPVRKVAFRNLPEAWIEEGNHFCQGLDLGPNSIAVGTDYGIVLRHFPVRSAAQMRKKIVNGGKALASLEGKQNIGVHWRRDYDSYMAMGDEYILRRIQEYNRLLSMRKF